MNIVQHVKMFHSIKTLPIIFWPIRVHIMCPSMRSSNSNSKPSLGVEVSPASDKHSSLEGFPLSLQLLSIEKASVIAVQG